MRAPVLTLSSNGATIEAHDATTPTAPESGRQRDPT